MIPYVDHWHTANVLDDLGNAQDQDTRDLFLASISFRAFALEAFLNHVGQEVFQSHWKKSEPCTVRKKIDKLLEFNSLQADYGMNPWLVVPQLVAFRNKVVHGKTKYQKSEPASLSDVYERGFYSALRFDWQESATSQGSNHVRQQTEQVMISIWLSVGRLAESLFRRGVQYPPIEIESEA